MTQYQVELGLCQLNKEGNTMIMLMTTFSFGQHRMTVWGIKHIPFLHI